MGIPIKCCCYGGIDLDLGELSHLELWKLVLFSDILFQDLDLRILQGLWLLREWKDTRCKQSPEAEVEIADVDVYIFIRKIDPNSHPCEAW